ncbi:MAG: cupredoxin domain-containing protein [Thaumarchaeota archaeon]|nr:cupredoxin domain-containing protein [Nitrososphaerota archaeon]
MFLYHEHDLRIMKSKPFGALFGLLALVAILGVAPAFGQTANEIDMVKGAGASASAACVTANNCFSPNPLNVAPGTTVTWKNTDTVSHYVTSGKPSDETTGTVFDSGNLIKPGSTFQFTFANAGTYDYFCTVHPWMTGQVIVGAASTVPSTTMSNMTTTVSNMTTTPAATTPTANTTTITPAATTPTANTTTTTPAATTPTANTTTTTPAATTTTPAATTTTPAATTTTPAATTPTANTTTTTPAATTPTAPETPQYSTSQTTVSSSPGPSGDEVAAWVAGIVIFAIVSGIGIWTAVRRK